jgi:hypothetical protein
MANNFLRKTSRDIGANLTVVGNYTVPANVGAVIVGLCLSNTTTSDIEANVAIDNGLSSYYIVNNAPITDGSSLVVAGRDQKIILQTGDSVKINSSAADSIDVVMSIMETDGVGFTDDKFTFNKTISANTENYDLKEDAMASGWDGTSILIANVTISSNVYVWSSNVDVPGFDARGIPSESTISIVNDGYIIGKGGVGAGTTFGESSPVGFGGNAMAISSNVTITNNGYIAGGGGGGGSVTGSGGGGGAGGGTGGGAGGNNNLGGALGQEGTNSAGGSTGGGGGRILPGIGGANASVTGVTTGNAAPGGGGGSGGGGGVSLGISPASSGKYSYFSSGAGGGGGWGASGGVGYFGTISNINPTSITARSGKGGNANIAGAGGSVTGASVFSNSGGAGGYAVALNGYSVTWAATGTRYGAIS